MWSILLIFSPFYLIVDPPQQLITIICTESWVDVCILLFPAFPTTRENAVFLSPPPVLLHETPPVPPPQYDWSQSLSLLSPTLSVFRLRELRSSSLAAKPASYGRCSQNSGGWVTATRPMHSVFCAFRVPRTIFYFFALTVILLMVH